MKASDAVSHEKSKRWKIFGYADRLAQLGPVEVAVYTKTTIEHLKRLIKNENILVLIPQVFVTADVFIMYISRSLSTSWIIFYMSLLVSGFILDSVIIYCTIQDVIKSPRFAVCEQGLWLDHTAFVWESIENCYWNRFKENELIVKSGKALILTAIPADCREEVEAAIQKRDKMKPLVEPTD
jgi:hypothetical protein